MWIKAIWDLREAGPDVCVFGIRNKRRLVQEKCQIKNNLVIVMSDNNSKNGGQITGLILTYIVFLSGFNIGNSMVNHDIRVTIKLKYQQRKIRDRINKTKLSNLLKTLCKTI